MSIFAADPPDPVSVPDSAMGIPLENFLTETGVPQQLMSTPERITDGGGRLRPRYGSKWSRLLKNARIP